MANVKISGLPAASTPLTGAELVPIVQSGVTSQTTVDDFGAAVSYTPSGTGAVTTTVQAKLRETVSVKDFGAVGDGVTNDTDAINAAANYINSIGGGKIIFPAGTYIVGKQTFAGATGLGYSYSPSNILKIQNCTEPVYVEGNGAILKLAAGLHFGSFDPVTGAVYNPPSMPFTNSNYAAHVCWGMIELFNNSNIVEINNLELDGNISNLIIGGTWGDTGRQLAGYGIRAYGNSQVQINNVYAHHHALDGIAIGYTGLTETSNIYPHTLNNVKSTYNARQGLSWVGGNNLTAINCDFSYTGQAVISTSPGAGIDIEAESSVCRKGVFINCNAENNAGAACVADSGDSADILFSRCKFVGNNNYAIWPRKPRMTFSDCLIVGAYVNPYYSASLPEDACKFVRCNFTDETKYAVTLYGIGSLGSNLSATTTQTNVLYDTCTFTTTRSRPGGFNGSYLKKCIFNLQAGTTYINNQDYVALINDTILDGCTINDNITVNPPTNAFYLATSSGTKSVSENYINSPSNKILWFTWSTGGGGAAGYYGINKPSNLASPYLSVIKGGGAVFLGYYGTADTYWGTAAPTTGTYKRGDRFFNSLPAVGSPKSWVKVTSGSGNVLGTDWISEGNL